MEGLVLVLAALLAITWYFTTNHPILFWLVIVPLTILCIVGFIRWLKK